MEKKLVLDYSKWRCGSNGEHKLGKGDTLLENEDGFQCCLGQFSLQLNKELTSADILALGEPFEVKKRIDILTDGDEDPDEFFGFSNSAVSTSAMDINDEDETTPEEKVSLLKVLFATEGYEIEVINKS